MGESEIRQRRTDFLNKASQILGSSLNYKATLETVARLTIHEIADWCLVDMVADDGALRRLVVAHGFSDNNADYEALTDRMTRRYSVQREAPLGPARVARTGEAEIVSHISDQMLVTAAQDAEHLRLLRRLRLTSYMSVPLQARGRTLGVITCIAAGSGRHYEPEDLTLLKELAHSAALAVDNAQLFSELEVTSRVNEQSHAQLDALFTSAPVGLAFLDTTLRHVRINDSLAAMNGLPAEAHLGRTATEILGEMGRKADALRRRVLETGEPLTGLELTGEAPGEPGRLRHWLVDYYPVKANGEVIGIGAVMVEITQRKQAEDRIARLSRLYAVLAATNEAIVRAADQSELFSEICRIAVEQGGFRMAWVGLIDGDLLRPVAYDGVVKADLDGIRIGASQRLEEQGLGGQAIRRGRPVICNDVVQDPQMAPWRDQALAQGYRACGAIPLRLGDQIVGSFNVYTGEPGFFDEEGLRLVTSMADNISLALDLLEHDHRRRQAEARLTRQALHDPLTGLPNRLLLMDRLQQALERDVRRQGLVATLFLDLDGMKTVNDNLGHEVGDQALIAVARRLRQAVRGGDTIARLGGDEFVVLCEEIYQEDEAIELARRIQAAVGAPDLLPTLRPEVTMTASIGIAIARGGERAEDLLRNADAAMYRAKHRGKAQYVLFDDAMRAQESSKTASGAP